MVVPGKIGNITYIFTCQSGFAVRAAALHEPGEQQSLVPHVPSPLQLATEEGGDEQEEKRRWESP